MDKQTVLRSAFASLMAITAVTASTTALAADKEKCYGVAKAGANDCSNASGTHSCAGQGKADMDSGEWKYVATGTCEQMGGGKTPEAAKKAAMMKQDGMKKDDMMKKDDKKS